MRTDTISPVGAPSQQDAPHGQSHAIIASLKRELESVRGGPEQLEGAVDE